MKTIIQNIAKTVSFLFTFLFFINSNAQLNKILDFANTTNGSYPVGSLISDGTFLYGMTSAGGINNKGTIFKIMPDGTGYSKLLDFAGLSNGSSPIASLLLEGNIIYGMTNTGGVNNLGTIFKIMTNGTGYLKLFDFAGVSNGSNPYGTLISDGTFLYGTTWGGGANNKGTIFKILPNGTGYSKLLDFAGISNGNNPNSSLISDGTFLYGTTIGGSNLSGTIFKILPNGTGFVNLLNFAGFLNGSGPVGSLIYDGTYLYGMTWNGGFNDMGTIYKILPDGTGYSKLKDFSGTSDGMSPNGSFISDGTFLYGMTSDGGLNSLGTIFKILPDGTEFVKLLDFSGTLDGSGPMGSLLLGGTSLYGMTQFGGTNEMGSVFKYSLSALSVKNSDFIGFSVYPNPVKNILTIQTPENHPIDKITITDLTGKKIIEQKPISNTVNVEQLQNGMYLLQTTSEGKNLVTKFIKQ